MPTYDYVCDACGHALEIFQSMSEAPKKKCPKCGKSKLARRIGAGAGFLFKGSGFYLTDYRSKSYTARSEAERKLETSGTAQSEAERKLETSGQSESTSSRTDSKAESESKSDTKSTAKPDPSSKPSAPPKKKSSRDD